MPSDFVVSRPDERPEPRPCPFCGSLIGSFHLENYRWLAWQCATCNAIGPDVRANVRGSTDAEDAAVREWNKRYPPGS